MAASETDGLYMEGDEMQVGGFVSANIAVCCAFNVCCFKTRQSRIMYQFKNVETDRYGDLHTDAMHRRLQHQ